MSLQVGPGSLNLLSLIPLLLVGSSALAQQPQLISANVQVSIAESESAATIVADYRLAQVRQPVRFNAIRLAGQRVELDSVSLQDEPPQWEALPGLFRLELGPVPNESVHLTVRYRVIGNLRRIPLLVPEAGAAIPESDIQLEVQGLSPDRVARSRFPRFSLDPGGRLVGSPDHLPAFITVVGRRAALSIPRVAEWLVISVTVLGTSVWLVWVLSSRRRASERRPPGADQAL